MHRRAVHPSLDNLKTKNELSGAKRRLIFQFRFFVRNNYGLSFSGFGAACFPAR